MEKTEYFLKFTDKTDKEFQKEAEEEGMLLCGLKIADSTQEFKDLDLKYEIEKFQEIYYCKGKLVIIAKKGKEYILYRNCYSCPEAVKDFL